jgi:predicted kinase
VKKVIVVSGLPGCGKSTLAEALAEKLSLPIFSVDPIESAIIQSGFNRGFETGLAAYLVAEALAAEQLKLGLSVIIDAVNPVQEARDMWKQLSNKHEVNLRIIECRLDPYIHKQRIEARVRNIEGIPEVTWEDVENRRDEYLPWHEERLIVDTSATTENNLQLALQYVKESSL